MRWSKRVLHVIYKIETITYILDIRYGSVGQRIALDAFEKQMLLSSADISKYNILDKWHAWTPITRQKYNLRSRWFAILFKACRTRLNHAFIHYITLAIYIYINTRTHTWQACMGAYPIDIFRPIFPDKYFAAVATRNRTGENCVGDKYYLFPHTNGKYIFRVASERVRAGASDRHTAGVTTE